MTFRTRSFDRRQMLAAAALFIVGLPMRHARAAEEVKRVHVFKNPSCGCCSEWAEHLRANGFDVTVEETSDLAGVKTRAGVPSELKSCHTANVEGYVIEGHVPAHAIKRLLAEKPKAVGLAVPGMPSGSPGMSGEPETFAVKIFDAAGIKDFGSYRGPDPV